MIRISTKTVITMVYSYLTLPVVLFFVGWLQPWVGIPLAALLIAAVVFAILKEKSTTVIEFQNGWVFAGILLLAALWVFLSGQGGYFYQSYDHHWRNAIFHDLVNFSWPVVYDKADTALVYYVGHWLPAALVGKLFGWQAANAALFAWTYAGVVLCAFLLFSRLQRHTAKVYFGIVAIFILWSGMDIIGTFIRQVVLRDSDFSHLERWSGLYQFSSNSTLLFWVYNQTVAPWLITLMLLREKAPGNIALLTALTLPYAPLPFIGMLPLAACWFAQGLHRSIVEKAMKTWRRSLLSIQTLAAAALAVVFYLYYSSNAAIGSGGNFFYWSQIQLPESTNIHILFYLLYVVFLLLEFGIVAMLLFPQFRKNPVYWVACVSLVVIPLFKLGQSIDFCMRASLPALFVIMVFVMDQLKELTATKKRSAALIALVICLVLGAATPLIEFRRGINAVIANHKIALVADNIKTLSNGSSDFDNFVTHDPNQKLFYRAIARR